MAKSISEIILEEWNKITKSKEFQKLLHDMDNINPSGKCVRCDKECGTGHLLCLDCYAELTIGQWQPTGWKGWEFPTVVKQVCGATMLGWDWKA